MKSQFHLEKCPILGGISPWEVLSRIKTDEPLFFLGAEQSPFSMLALSFDEVDRDDFMFCEVDSDGAETCMGLGMTLGQVALLTYDAFNPWCGTASVPCRFFRISRSLIWDKSRQEWFLCSQSGFAKAKYQLAWPLPAAAAEGDLPALSIDWKSTWTDAQYLEAVAQSLEDIREGRFYQINLLRFWEHHGLISRAYLLRRLRKYGGPFSAIIDLPDLGLVSWSPERFVKIYRESGQTFIEAEPIKGTRPVVADPTYNAALIDELRHSLKDKAELHMIVDLMRNDLQRVCSPRGVTVVDSGTLQSFANVHHLVARVRGELKPKRRLDEICRALCPGGSITGAPKREVMDVIHRREERERGYFMGNLFYRDDYSGRLDSSILIRTAVRRGVDSWEYAAGSGITVKSHAYEELQEVLTKARIILENPW